MKYELEFTRQYLKDLKLARRRGVRSNFSIMFFDNIFFMK